MKIFNIILTGLATLLLSCAQADEACFVTTHSADGNPVNDIKTCFENLSLPKSEFAKVCNQFGMFDKAKEGDASITVEDVAACPANFDGTCVASYMPDQKPGIKTFYYSMINNPSPIVNKTMLETYKKSCTRKIGPLVPGEWISGSK